MKKKYVIKTSKFIDKILMYNMILWTPFDQIVEYWESIMLIYMRSQ